MVDHQTVRRLALALPGARDDGQGDKLAFSVGGKGFAWTYSARLAPRGPRTPHPEVLAVRCTLERKEMLLEAAPERFFDDDHYRGYPAVLVRLDAIDEDELISLLSAAWTSRASRRLLSSAAATISR